MRSSQNKRFFLGVLQGLTYSLVAAFAFIFALAAKEGVRLSLGDVSGTVIVAVLVTLSMTGMYQLVFPRTRKFNLLLAVTSTFAAMTVTIFCSLALGMFLNDLLLYGRNFYGYFIQAMNSRDLRYTFYYAPVMLLVFLFFNGIAQKLGPGVLLAWVTGRYHQPQRVERIFMFLDLRDSTTLAEQMGDLKFSAFIRDFFSDITNPLLDHFGQVSHFIGDEVVLFWKPKNGFADANCIRCFFAIMDEVDRKADKYLQTYGVVPRFKAGAHCGTVVATDVGDIKSEIVFHGDVLNVAARLQGLCNSEGVDFIISGELRSQVGEADGILVEPLGERTLKGRAQPIEIFSCRTTEGPKVKDLEISRSAPIN